MFKTHYRFQSLRVVIPVLLLFFSHLISAEENKHSAAVAVVDKLHSHLLQSMQAANEQTFEDRYAYLEPLIIESFDTPVISKVILSRYWKKLSEEEQHKFKELFMQQTIATYASRFDSYSDEVFNFKNVEELKKGRILVRTEIKSENDKPVNLDYLMHRNNGRWLIISVIANGVNDLSLKRAEYSTVIEDGGFEKLVTNIEEKIAEIQNKEEV